MEQANIPIHRRAEKWCLSYAAALQGTQNAAAAMQCTPEPSPSPFGDCKQMPASSVFSFLLVAFCGAEFSDAPERRKYECQLVLCNDLIQLLKAN
jgi:hypothetical protein